VITGIINMSIYCTSCTAQNPSIVVRFGLSAAVAVICTFSHDYTVYG